MNVTETNNYVDLEDLFRSLPKFKKDVRLADKVNPNDYQNSLDANQKKNLEKQFTDNIPLVMALALQILKSFEESKSSTSKHQKIHDYIVASDSWVHEVFCFTFSQIKKNTYYYNLDHIFDSDKNGGGHIQKATLTITPILENTRTGVVYGYYSNGDRDKKSTFFPQSMQTRKNFLNFMNECVSIAVSNNTELLYSLKDDMYVIRYIRFAQRTISSAFPCLAVINFDSLDRDKPQFHVDEYLSIFNSKEEIFSGTPAFATEKADFYDISGIFKVPGIYLKHCKAS